MKKQDEYEEIGLKESNLIYKRTRYLEDGIKTDIVEIPKTFIIKVLEKQRQEIHKDLLTVRMLLKTGEERIKIILNLAGSVAGPGKLTLFAEILWEFTI